MSKTVNNRKENKKAITLSKARKQSRENKRTFTM